MTAQITLTEDQQKASEALIGFLASDDPVFVLEGYSGTGKSTLINKIINDLPTTLKTIKLINPNAKTLDVCLTATTNKAAENLAHITGRTASTIQSHLSLVVHTDWQTRQSSLVPRTNKKQANQLLFIDEASYIDRELLKWIFTMTENSKIVFIGDPAQLTPVKARNTPVFDAKFPTARLTQVVRQAEGNPIVSLSTKFRETVTSGQFFSFKPDGISIKHLPKDKFEAAFIQEFTRPDWKANDSKILAWTNKAVHDYNAKVNEACSGQDMLAEGDYAICNNFFKGERKNIKTDETVLITAMSTEVEIHTVKGHWVTINYTIKAFMPTQANGRKIGEKVARKSLDTTALWTLNETWIDLRPMYACTINKSQGSTYNKVFIDLDDIKRCNSGEQIARLMYVGVSRARTEVILTGDLV